jgi:hypothetical protein
LSLHLHLHSQSIMLSARSFASLARAGPSRLAPQRVSSLSFGCTTKLTRQISAVALGKRPILSPRAGLLPIASASLGSRAFSLSSLGIGSAPKPTETVVGTPPHDPILSSPHSDLQSSTTALPQSLSTPSSPTSAVDAVSTSSAAPSSLSSQLESLPSVAATDPGLLPQSPALSSVPTLEELVTNSGMSLSEVLHSPEAVHAAMKVSDLSLLGLEHGYLNLAGWVRDALVAGHTITGLPWYVLGSLIGRIMAYDQVGNNSNSRSIIPSLPPPPNRSPNFPQRPTSSRPTSNDSPLHSTERCQIIRRSSSPAGRTRHLAKVNER